MAESPLKKRIKIGVPYKDIETQLRSLNNIRLNASDIVEQICAVETLVWIEKLEKTEVDIGHTVTFDIPDDVEFKTDLKEQIEREKKVFDHIKFLNILKHKQKCKISKLIDEI